jgi:hypothetical protein
MKAEQVAEYVADFRLPVQNWRAGGQAPEASPNFPEHGAVQGL